MPNSEWLDLLLVEIDRKAAEAKLAEEERVRRNQAGSGDGGTVS